MLGLCCCFRAFSSRSRRGLSFAAVLLIAGPLLVPRLRPRARRPQELQTWAQQSPPRAPGHRLSGCGGHRASCSRACGSSLSSALAGRFVPTVPPGKSQEFPLDGMVSFPGWGLWSDCVSAFPALCDAVSFFTHVWVKASPCLDFLQKQ